MRLSRVELSNWLRYRGEHWIAIGEGAHAVVARWSGDAGRSNWAGKTSLLTAIVWSLYGARPPSARVNDEIVTHGEHATRVRLVFDDGFEVVRSLKRGESVKLSASWLDVAAKGKRRKSTRVDASGARAQEVIGERVGLSEDDFTASCYFEQKQMARLAKLKRSDLLDLFVRWFRLDQIEQAAQLALDRARPIAAEVADLRAMQVALDGVEGLNGAIDLNAADARAEAATERVRELQAAVDEHAEWIIVSRGADEFDEIAARAVQLKRELVALDQPRLVAELASAEAVLAKARAAKERACDELAEVNCRAMNGLDDGQCPVMRAPCPCRGEVDAVLARSTALVDEAAKKAQSAALVLDVASRSFTAARAALGNAEKKLAEFQQLGERARFRRGDKQLIEQRGRPPDVSGIVAQLDAAHEERRAAQLALGAAMQATREADRVAAERNRVTEALASASARFELHTVARRVFVEAMREVAESSAGEVVQAANATLAAAGIELSISVEWQREAKGLATACGSCGLGFPMTAKIKQCSRCGAEREAKVVFEPRIVLSDVSGAAEDIAGIALQLAAAAWLRRDRGSSWQLALVDEPFGALDTTNRSKLATCFAESLVRLHGFGQALVVAHDPDTLDAMPGRIEIVASENGSEFV